MPPIQTPVLVHEVLSEVNMGNITATLPTDISIYLEIVKIFQLGENFPRREIKFFMPPFMRFFHRVSTVFPLLQWGFHLMTRNPHSFGGHGGIAFYEFYFVIWPIRCIHVMSTVKLQLYSLLIDYPSSKMDSL